MTELCPSVPRCSTVTMAILIVLFLQVPVPRILALSPIRTLIQSSYPQPQSYRFPNTQHYRRLVGHHNLDLYRRHKNQHTLHMNFFKNMLDQAFKNDDNLSNDRSLQQYDKPEDEYEDIISMQNKRQEQTPKTEVQKRWLESQASIKSSTNSNNDNNNEKNRPATGTTLYPTKTTARTLPGAPLSTSLITNTTWELSLYLTGTPDFDPSNSLFGSRVSISTRAGKDDSSSPSLASLGFAIGCDVLPTKPSVLLPSFQFLSDGRCTVLPTSFTTGENEGAWTLSEDGKTVQFSVYVEGWKRTVTTKGTIQNVYWSDGDDTERNSKATYSIPGGWVYGEAGVGYGKVPGRLDMAPMTQRIVVGGADEVGRGNPTGILRFEKRMGVLGAASKMVPCGMFSAEIEEKSNEYREDQ